MWTMRIALGWILLVVALVALAQADSDGDGIPDDTDPYPHDSTNIPSDRNSTIWRVAEVYVATLNRAVDAEGLDYWVTEVETRPEWEPLTVAQSFFDQPEVQSQYPDSLGYGALIERLYVNILGREADQEGYDYWLSELSSGRLRPNQMIIALINGLWANPHAYRNGDVARFSNLVKVSLAFADEQRDGGFRLSQVSDATKAQFLALSSDLFDDVDASTTNTASLISTIGTLLASIWDESTRDQISNVSFWSEATRIYRNDNYRIGRPGLDMMYLRIPNVENCDPGELTQWAKDTALQGLNELRYLHALPAVEYLDYFDAEVQSASLVQLANDYYVGHRPEKSARCYSELAYDGASSSNLSYGSIDRNPLVKMIGWAHDARNISNVMSVGHRRHILRPELGFLAYGAAKGYAAQKVFGFGDTTIEDSFREEFIAFPHKTFPYVLVAKEREKPTPWSFHLVTEGRWAAEHDYFSSAAVTIVETESGRAIPVENVYFDNRAFGRLHGVLSWMVPEYDYDREYQVTVSGVSLATGEIKDYVYPVTLARYDILDVSEPLEISDTRTGRGLVGSINEAGDRDSAAIYINTPGTYTLIGQSRFSNWAFYVEIYDSKKKLLVETDSERDIYLDAGNHTISVGRCSSDGWCYTLDSLDYSVELR